MKHNLLRKEEDSDPISVVSVSYTHLRAHETEDQDKKEGKRGKKVGIAYELDNGEIIYVPE